MFPKIINLSLLLVMKELEKALENFPEYPYQVAFSIQELRHKLIVDVLGQIPNYYALLEASQELPGDPNFLYSSFEDRVLLELLIRESIVRLCRENRELITCYISQKDNSLSNPSPWLG